MRGRLAQVALIGGLVLTVASMATAQQVAQPIVRLGNWIEVGNDVFMHLMASADIRYKTVHNWDFEDKVRDRIPDRGPGNTTTQEGESDLSYAELRLGAEFRYQKNLTLYLLFEHQQIFDGNLIDDRSNSTNPGGTDVFGRAAVSENPAFHIERYWIDYKFAGTPLRLRVSADPWYQDQAGLVSDDDPRFALFGDFGDVDVMAAAVVQFESQRLGLTNDNDFIYYTFSGGYNLKPHRFQLDVTYFRDRFQGADTASPVQSTRSSLGFQGQKTDSVLIMGSWSGRVGPVRALMQGNILTGTARGGTSTVAGALPTGVAPGRHYDIFAGSVVAYAEADRGMVRPFVGLIYGSGDGDPTDNKLHGFMTLPVRDTTDMKGSSFFSLFEISPAFAGRDYACPARAQGVTVPGAGPRNIGTAVLGGSAGTGFAECSHSQGQPFNDRLGNTSHLGINTTYSNPGSLLVPAGVKLFPLKGHGSPGGTCIAA
jgi:hypothetical protein